MLHLVPLLAAFAMPAPIVVTPDVAYAASAGEPLKLDVVAPATGGPHPCVILLHGGAWKTGTRKDLSTPKMNVGTPGKSLAEVLAAKGFATASVGYRLAPKDRFPAQIQDAKTAVRFLRANAAKYNIDPDRIGAMGFSAGGHIAALLGTADKSAGFEGDLYPEQSSRVSCVVDFFGPTDLMLYCETPALEKIFFVPLIGCPSGDDPGRYKKASPIEHVTKDDPPFLIVHGTADLIVPVIHSERLHDKLVATGVKSELVTVKGEGHGWGGAKAVETIDRAAAFLAEHLRKGK